MTNKPIINRPGYDKLWGWFSLSYASWLAVPRVLLHAMPDEWQERMATLLMEMDEHLEYEGEFDTYVQLKKKGKFVKIPEWLSNYRHPDPKLIESIKK